MTAAKPYSAAAAPGARGKSAPGTAGEVVLPSRGATAATGAGDFLVVIPARAGSTRFPRKVLADLAGLPVVEWCRRAAVGARIGPVVVATDDPAVRRALEPYGADVALTSRRCASGSDRVWEAAARRDGPLRFCSSRFRFVMNLQGDEPLLSSRTVRRVAEALRRSAWADIATAVVAIRNAREAADPNVVKAAVGAEGRSLYFSRAPIPYPRSSPASKINGAGTGYWRHLGIYAYRREALRRFVSLRPSALERRESLEQLRALEAGMAVVSAVVDDESVAIDTPEDLRRARRLIERRERSGVSPHG